MTVFPYFSSEQLSRVIFTLNQMIQNETNLSTIITRLFHCVASFIHSYSVLYFIITKQIMYVLHLQLNKLSSSQKNAYGLSDFSYNIDTDILSFSFWKKNKLKRERDTMELNRIVLCREEDEETHLMKIVGKSNGYVFAVDLVEYRIFDIILKVCVWLVPE